MNGCRTWSARESARAIRPKAVTALAVMVTACLTILNAADGDLDLSFGSGGRVMTDFSGLNDYARGVAMDANGRIVVAGHSGSDYYAPDVSLARYNPDGSLDATFGTDGRVMSPDVVAVDGIAIDRDDSIVLVGFRRVDWYIFETSVVRFFADGTRDMSFGTGGRALTRCDVSPLSEVAIDDAGRIVVAGTSATDRGVFCVVRFNHDGSPDNTFGTGGYATATFPGHAFAFGLATGAGGEVVVAGIVQEIPGDPTAHQALARFTNSGTLDPAFGDAGMVVSSVSAEGYDVAIDDQGRTVVVGAEYLGVEWPAYPHMLVARYTPNGTLDTEFGGTGSIAVDFSNGPGQSSRAVAVDIDREGRIVAAGYADGALAEDFAVVRLNADGSPDTSFGVNGTVRTDFDSSSESAVGLAIDADDTIVVAGSATNVATGGNYDFAVARYGVRAHGYRFGGFFAPVDNAPAFNVINAGRAVPVKFSLNGNQVLDIFAAGSPASQPIACTAGASFDVVEVTLTASTSSLKYDPATDEYTYIWKTDKAWAGTCRQLVLTLNDGSTHVANFQISR